MPPQKWVSIEMKIVREKEFGVVGRDGKTGILGNASSRDDLDQLSQAASHPAANLQLHPGVFKLQIKEAIFYHKKALSGSIQLRAEESENPTPG